MPLYKTKCQKCGAHKSLLTMKFSWEEIEESLKKCPSCEGELVRDGKGPSTSVKETLDNGAMPRAVERFADIEAMKRERIDKADPLAGKKNHS